MPVGFTHETVRDWEARFAPLITDALRKRRRGMVGPSWYIDETYVEDGAGTNLMAGDDVAFQTQNWDDTDQEMAVSMMRESLPASQDTFDLQGIHDSGETNRNWEQRWLLMLNLEKASVDGDVLQDPIYRGMVPTPR